MVYDPHYDVRSKIYSDYQVLEGLNMSLTKQYQKHSSQIQNPELMNYAMNAFLAIEILDLSQELLMPGDKTVAPENKTDVILDEMVEIEALLVDEIKGLSH